MPRIDFTEYCKDKYIIDLGNYEIKEENGKTYAVRKQSKYPKTYKECYNLLNDFNFTDVEQYDFEIDWRLTIKDKNYGNILSTFAKLLICRDAYWNIAGEKLGLGKPWEPNWLNTEQDKFVLYTHNNNICSNCFILGHNVLAFPTEEMRDAFYENFKELIEQCKELL